MRVPVIIGVNWYVEFDRPEKDSHGHWWVARDGQLTRIRGGHCVVLPPVGARDPESWWAWFNQQNEGICVSEGSTRGQGLLNRVRYQPRWLYDRCKERDGIPNEEGTFVRTAGDVMRELGLVKAKPREQQILEAHALDDRQPDPSAGISANRWATSIDDILATIGAPSGRDYVEFENSWGKDYPRKVRVPATVVERLRNEDGEFMIVTDL